MPALKLIALFALGLALYLAVAIVLSRSQRPIREAVSLNDAPSGLEMRLPAEITISTWNLGYAGLGADSDFVADGGKSLFPPSRAAARRNLDGILAVVRDLSADVAFFQEVSDASPLSYWTPLAGRLREAMQGRLWLFQRDMATRLLPFPLAVRHGLVLTSDARPVSAERVPLPLEPGPTMGLIMRQYALQVARFTGGDGGEWAFINLHLSAFDDGGLRFKQLDAVFEAAATEFTAGRHVVVGGDWNMALKNAVDRDAAPELFWLRQFPIEKLPSGWRIVAPEITPTVRTNHKPYVAGENATATIDGFLVSPNVAVLSVEAIDTGFAMSDHQPVIARLTAQ